MPLKPQDLLVCLELHSRNDASWTYSELAGSLGISPSEANAAVNRATHAGLLAAPLARRGKPGVVRAALLEFLVHGVRYAFAASPGRIVRGMPTGHSAPPLDAMLQADGDPPLVWADAEGGVRGRSVEPLYPSVPGAARRNTALYELLALVDALRCGRSRERSLAADELEKRLRHAERP